MSRRLSSRTKVLIFAIGTYFSAAPAFAKHAGGSGGGAASGTFAPDDNRTLTNLLLDDNREAVRLRAKENPTDEDRAQTAKFVTFVPASAPAYSAPSYDYYRRPQRYWRFR